MLSITLVKGVGLKNTRVCVVASLGSQHKTSHVAAKSTDPQFNEVLEFGGELGELLYHGLLLKVVEKKEVRLNLPPPIPPLYSPLLTFHFSSSVHSSPVQGYLTSSESTLGEISVTLDGLRKVDSLEFTEALPGQGSILFSVAWLRVEKYLFSHGTLRVHLSHATDLKSMDSNGFSDPYVKLTLKGTTHKSKTMKKTLNPKWDEGFEFTVRRHVDLPKYGTTPGFLASI